MKKNRNKELNDFMKIIIKSIKIIFKFIAKGYMHISKIVEKYVPKEHVLIAFWIATTLSFFGENYFSDKIYMISWFVTTTIITIMINKQFSLYIKKLELKDKEDKEKRENAKRNNN